MQGIVAERDASASPVSHDEYKSFREEDGVSYAYASVNVFTVRTGKMDAFVALQRDAFLPLLRRQPGFLAFEVVRSGADTGVATLWWASEEARRAATPALTAWVEEHLEPLFVALDNPAGPVVLSWRDNIG